MRLEFWQIILAIIVTAPALTCFGYFLCALGTVSIVAESRARLANIDAETQVAFDAGIREGQRRERQEAFTS